MITILTSFKPFTGLDAIHQVNALTSWRALWPEAEILAFGLADPECPKRFQVRFVSSIPSFEPDRYHRIDLIFRHAEAHGAYRTQMYINGDIILFDDCREALELVAMERFLLIGQRTDVDVEALLDLSSQAARDRCRRSLLHRGVLKETCAIDYFCYKKGSIPNLPSLYLGAAGWDNLLIFHCRRARVPVIDATSAVHVFHQNHFYRLTNDGKRFAYDGDAAKANRQLGEHVEQFFATTDASHVIANGEVRSSLCSPNHLWRRIYMYPVIRGWPTPTWLPFRALAAVARVVTS